MIFVSVHHTLSNEGNVLLIYTTTYLNGQDCATCVYLGKLLCVTQRDYLLASATHLSTGENYR